MRKHIIAFVILFSVSLSSQTAPTAKTPAKKPATAATSATPTAIIDTTAGKLTCTLFPDKAPEGVKNFVGLARGTKDWTNPSTGRKMHGVPLYNGTIFGQCDQESVELVKKIARIPRNTDEGPNKDRPDNPVKINKITILHMGAAPAHAPMHKPAAKAAPAKQQ